MQHLDEGLAHAWIDGALSRHESAEIEAHVANCAECAALVANARGIVAGASRIVASLDVVRGNVAPTAVPPKREAGPRSLWRTLRLTPGRAAVAATVMIAVASILAVRHNTPDNRGFDANKLVVPPAATPAQPSVNAKRPAAHDSVVRSTPHQPEVKRIAAPPAVVAGVPAIAAAEPSAEKTANTANAANVAATPVLVAPAAAAARVAESASRRVAESPSRFSPESLKANDAGPGGRTLRGQHLDVNAGAQRLQSVVAKTELTVPLICYELRPDSIATRASLPVRFALKRGAVARPNVVAPVAVNGTLDAPIEGSSWAELPDGTIRVIFARASLLISGETARATWDTDSAELEIARIGCTS